MITAAIERLGITDLDPGRKKDEDIADAAWLLDLTLARFGQMREVDQVRKATP